MAGLGRRRATPVSGDVRAGPAAQRSKHGAHRLSNQPECKLGKLNVQAAHPCRCAHDVRAVSPHAARHWDPDLYCVHASNGTLRTNRAICGRLVCRCIAHRAAVAHSMCRFTGAGNVTPPRTLTVVDRWHTYARSGRRTPSAMRWPAATVWTTVDLPCDQPSCCCGTAVPPHWGCSVG